MAIWIALGIVLALVVFTIVLVVGSWKRVSTDEAAQGEKQTRIKTKIAMLFQALYHTRGGF